jgi:Sigma-70 region 2
MRCSSDHPAGTSDAELLRAARRDDRAFRVLYDRHATRVCRFLERRCDDRETALDLTAEVFARAWLQRARFRDESCRPSSVTGGSCSSISGLAPPCSSASTTPPGRSSSATTADNRF